MKRFLRWFVDFLERKFPDKVVVTDAAYKQLTETMVGQATQIVELKQKLSALELNLMNVNTAMGFAAPKLGMLER